MQRPEWDKYFLDIAVAVSARATCPRLSVGCVIVNDGRIHGTGYNGSWAGKPHCTDVGCDLLNNSCKRTIHAEENALTYSRGLDGSCIIAYTTHAPCLDCTKLLWDSSVDRVIYLHDYKTPDYRHYAGFIRKYVAP